MTEASEWLTELFLSNNMWSVLGPLGLVFIGWYATNKVDKKVGLLYFVFLMFFSLNYLPLIATHYLHVGIILFGGILVCVIPNIKN
jgi:hypothetical protein